MAYSAAQELSSIAFDKIIGGALDAVVKAQNNAAMTTVNFIKEIGFTGDKPTTVEFKYEKETAPAYRTYQIKIDNGGSNYSPDEAITLKVGDVTLASSIILKDGVITEVRIENTANLSGVSTDSDITVTSAVGTGASLKLTVSTTPAVTQKMNMEIPLLTMLPIPNIRIANTDIEFNVKINSINTTSESSDTTTNFKNETNAGYRSWWSGVNVNTSFNTSVASQKKSSSTEEIKKEFSLQIKIHAVQDEMPAGIAKVLDILEENMNSRPVLE